MEGENTAACDKFVACIKMIVCFFKCWLEALKANSGTCCQCKRLIKDTAGKQGKAVKCNTDQKVAWLSSEDFEVLLFLVIIIIK